MKRILVVDDDQDSCELLREIFCAEGWHVDTALSPTQAFTVAEKEKIDLVVSDVNLEANQSGLDLLKNLRMRCPVILVTGFGTLDSAVEAAREGAWDFISKPFKVQEVVAIARRALEHDHNSGGADRGAERRLAVRHVRRAARRRDVRSVPTPFGGATSRAAARDDVVERRRPVAVTPRHEGRTIRVVPILAWSCSHDC